MLTVDLRLGALWQPLAEENHSGDAVRDWIGNRWPQGSFPALPPPAWRSPRFPVGGDGFRAGEIEWIGFAVAAHFAARDDERLPTAMEMGASQAPWCLSWVRAMQRLAPSRRARAVAFEAGPSAVRATQEFWAAQELAVAAEQRDDGSLLLSGESWQVEWYPRAVASGGGSVFFPDVDVAVDNGARIMLEPGSVDHRGREVECREVTAVDPVKAVDDAGFVHFLHMDLQGAEADILRAGSAQSLAGKVAVVQLGTHSRETEAVALASMPAAGFVLLGEEPCEYQIVNGNPVLWRDGEQLWVSAAVRSFLDDASLVADGGESTTGPTAFDRRPTAADVVAVYQLALDRLPESEQIIQDQISAHSTVASLLSAVLGSAEFLGRVVERIDDSGR